MNSRSVPTVLLMLFPGTVYTCCGFVTKKEALYEPHGHLNQPCHPGIYIHH